MKHKLLKQKMKSILFKIFGVFLILTLSTILFILAFWLLIVGKPNPIFAHIHLIIALIILIITGFVVASFVIRRILRPLSLLDEAVKKVSLGSFDQMTGIKSNDELGELAVAFNRMTSEIKKMILARDYLLLDVSHELRTPVTRAKLALEMLPESPEKESLAGELKEMEIMITEILESERLKSGAIDLKFAKTDVKELLQKLTENYQRENKQIVLLPVVENVTINIDKTLILTVLHNLVDNSLKYSSVKAKPVEISVILEDQYVVIQIEDWGQGIPEDKLAYVFEPFFRVDQSRSRKTGGYGLGLHLCKRIMDLHAAEIRLSNKADNDGVIATLTFKISRS